MQSVNEIRIHSRVNRCRSVDLSCTSHRVHSEVSIRSRLLQSRIKTMLSGLVNSLVSAAPSTSKPNFVKPRNTPSIPVREAIGVRRLGYSRRNLALFTLLVLLPLACFLCNKHVRISECRRHGGDTLFELFSFENVCVYLLTNASCIPI